MNFQDMMNQSHLYKEMLEVIARKPQLIAECKQKITTLKAEIEALELEKAHNNIKKVNPAGSGFDETRQVEIREEIQSKELEIRSLEKEIKTLETVKTKDVFDVNAVIQECSSILNIKREEIDNMVDDIIAAREAYFTLIDQYNQKLRQHNQYSVTVSGKINNVINEGFKPRFMGDHPWPANPNLHGRRMADELIQGHRRHINDLTTEPNNVGLFNS